MQAIVIRDSYKTSTKWRDGAFRDGYKTVVKWNLSNNLRISR